MGVLGTMESLDERASGRRVAAPSTAFNRRQWRALSAQRRAELRRLVRAFEHPEDPDDLLMVADMTITTIRRLVLRPMPERWPSKAQAEQLWLEDLLVHAHNLVGGVFSTWLAVADGDDPMVARAEEVVGMLNAVEEASAIRLTRLRRDVGRLPAISLVLAFLFSVTLGVSFTVGDRASEILLIVSYVCLGAALIPNVLYRRRRREPIESSRNHGDAVV